MLDRQRRVARAAGVVMAAFAANRLLGLVRQIVFGAYFGTGPEMDAYVAALRIPDALFLVVAGGALGSAFIPLFTGRLARQDEDAAWALASSIATLLVTAMVPLSLAAIAAAPWLVGVFVAPGLDPISQARTVDLMRVMMISPTIFGLSGVVMGVLNAHQHFLLPALAPIVYNIGLIAGGLISGPTPAGAMGPAIGMVVGSLGHLLVQIPALARIGGNLRPILHLRDPGVLEVGRLLVPRALGMAVAQLNVLVSSNLASRLGPSAISGLEVAWRVMLLPQGVFAQAVGIAVFPTFAEQAALGETSALRETVSSALRLLIALTVPASVGLALLGRPIVAAMFQRGVFGAESTALVASALAFFSVGLVGLSALEVLGRAFYALHDTWTPVLATVGAVILNALLGVLLPATMTEVGYPALSGLALSTAVAALVESGVLYVLLRRRIGSLRGRATLLTAAKVTAAAGGMAVALQLLLTSGPQSPYVQTVVGVPAGVLVYAGLAWILGVDQLRTAARMVLRKAG